LRTGIQNLYAHWQAKFMIRFYKYWRFLALVIGRHFFAWIHGAISRALKGAQRGEDKSLRDMFVPGARRFGNAGIF
jgi:hypothetical protein